MEETSCYSYFSIGSNGVRKDGLGFVANENSIFDPDYISDKLAIQPFDIHRKGAARKYGVGPYPSSGWSALKQTEPVFYVNEQCLKIVRELREKIPLLLEIKQEFDVFFCLEIVPYSYNGQTPAITFDREVIEFCYLTGTEIDVDLYVGWDD